MNFSQFVPERLKPFFRPYFDANQDRISKVLSRVPRDSTVLDIGCVRHELASQEWRDPPAGEFLHADLSRHAERVTGMDLIEEEVERMRAEGYDVVVGNAESFEFDRTFDVIVAGELIEHLSNPGLFLDNCRENLSDDGQLILTTPNPRRFHMVLWYLSGREHHANPEHTMWFDHYVLRELAQRSGFKIYWWDLYCPGTKFSTSLFYYLGLGTLGGGGYVFDLRLQK